MTAVLIACAHGTRFEEGRVVVRELLEVLRSTAPAGVEVLEAYVDVHGPYVSDVVAVARERTDDIVIVPLLLSTGYHTEVDLVEAAGGLPVAPALGPHPVLAEILADRVRAAGAAPDDTVVLAAAGSTRPGAVVDVERMAELMADAGVTGPVVTAYAAASDPRIPDAVATARADGRRTVAASYVLAPGHFSRVIEKADADLTTAPIGADPRLATVVWERWAAARRPQASVAEVVPAPSTGSGTSVAEVAELVEAPGRASVPDPSTGSGTSVAEVAELVEASGHPSASVEVAELVEAPGRALVADPSTGSGTSVAEVAELVEAPGRALVADPSTGSGTSVAEVAGSSSRGLLAGLRDLFSRARRRA
ncbi:sirohydrochlorin chelatase [Microbacterium sp. JC 701]|uniref:sirohydrochlorin chelatase n=1 Tax=Microbacterium sp. JC 701 TaxID=2897389 RepID=UPI001E2E9C4D|nr:CbiX/SirB N-terminal domain-containing protein [Microbacterium sp. JC 701]MCD2169041.1 sirohydrochlorin chelatase [Microbacterium sp. JC 701]